MSFDEIVAELPNLTGPELQQIVAKAEFLAGLERIAALKVQYGSTFLNA